MAGVLAEKNILGACSPRPWQCPISESLSGCDNGFPYLTQPLATNIKHRRKTCYRFFTGAKVVVLGARYGTVNQSRSQTSHHILSSFGVSSSFAGSADRCKAQSKRCAAGGLSVANQQRVDCRGGRGLPSGRSLPVIQKKRPLRSMSTLSCGISRCAMSAVGTSPSMASRLLTMPA